jgi:hypothetical protein
MSRVLRAICMKFDTSAACRARGAGVSTDRTGELDSWQLAGLERRS